MPVDPRLNCAAEICCSPPEAQRAVTEILCECGLSENLAHSLARELKIRDIVLLPGALARTIREIALPEGRLT